MENLPFVSGSGQGGSFLYVWGMSGMLWLEFLRNHRKYETVLWHAWIGGGFMPDRYEWDY